MLDQIHRYLQHLVVQVNVTLSRRHVAVSSKRHQHSNPNALVCRCRDECAATAVYNSLPHPESLSDLVKKDAIIISIESDGECHCPSPDRSRHRP